MKSGASTKQAFVTYREVRPVFVFFRVDVPSGVSDWLCSLRDHPPAPALCQHRHREEGEGLWVEIRHPRASLTATRSRNRTETLVARLARHEAFYSEAEHKENNHADAGALITITK